MGTGSHKRRANNPNYSSLPSPLKRRGLLVLRPGFGGGDSNRDAGTERTRECRERSAGKHGDPGVNAQPTMPQYRNSVIDLVDYL
jgi:hypothetical protein